MKLSLMLVGALAGLAIASTADAAVYSAAGDFSPTSNPNSPWTYGDGVTGTSFAPLTVTGSQGNYNYWQDAHPSSSVPWIGVVTGSALSTGSIYYPAGYLVVHPGPATDGIVQWKAPSAGTYTLSGSFTLLDTSPSGIIGEVYKNNSLLYSSPLTGPGANQGAGTVGGSESFGGTYSLLAGDILSFGVNNAGSYFNDSTGLKATITSAVPEPSSWALLMLAIGGLGMVLRANGRANRELNALRA
jgi:hypothetical protein